MRIITAAAALITAIFLIGIIWYILPITNTNAPATHRQIINSIYMGTTLSPQLSIQNKTITTEEIRHLQDVSRLISWLYLILPILLVTSVSLPTPRIRYNLIKQAGLYILLVIAITATFNSSFILFHQIFFPQGNWSFSYDSLLIQLYPLNVWRNISLLWLILSGFVYLSLLRYTNTRISKLSNWSA